MLVYCSYHTAQTIINDVQTKDGRMDSLVTYDLSPWVDKLHKKAYFVFFSSLVYSE